MHVIIADALVPGFSAFTRVFDALWTRDRCKAFLLFPDAMQRVVLHTADPGSFQAPSLERSRLKAGTSEAGFNARGFR
jgi:hypothetical protein